MPKKRTIAERLLDACRRRYGEPVRIPNLTKATAFATRVDDESGKLIYVFVGRGGSVRTGASRSYSYVQDRMKSNLLREVPE